MKNTPSNNSEDEQKKVGRYILSKIIGIIWHILVAVLPLIIGSIKHRIVLSNEFVDTNS